MTGFAQIIGQEHIKEHLRESILSGMISHACILQGEKGSGKSMIADAFAMTLLCEEGQAEPCMNCHSCKQALSGNHPDIRHLIPAKPDVIQVKEIREQVVNDVGIKPYSSDYKVYIIPNAENMNPMAQNALLKTLEDPPSYVVILLLCQNENMLLETIRSRCRTLSLRPLKDEQIQEYLMREKQMPDYQAKICAAFARGSIGRALMLGESDFDELNAETVYLIKNIKTMDVAAISEEVKKITKLSAGLSEFLDCLFLWYRDIALCKATGSTEKILYSQEKYTIAQVADNLSYEGIEKILSQIQKTGKRLDANVNAEILLELLLFAMKEN